MLIRFKNEKIINLDNVSNIFVDEDGSKVIFNMNYSVKIFGDKTTPDYIYWKYSSLQELISITRLLNNNISDWTQPQKMGQRYVNPKCISSIGTDDSKNRVIINLCYNITHPKDNNKLTSDFVFFDFTNKEEYRDFYEVHLNNKLKGK